MTISDVFLFLLLSGVGLTIGSGWFQPIKIAKQKKDRSGLNIVSFNSPKLLHFGTALALLIFAFQVQWLPLVALTLGYNAGLVWWQVSVFSLGKR